MSSLKNDFEEETYYLFEDCKCWVCGNRVHEDTQERVDALHHILGRCSNSPLNAAPVHNSKASGCHIGNGKLSHLEIKERLLKKTLRYLTKRGYTFTEKDSRFLKEHSNMYS